MKIKLEIIENGEVKEKELGQYMINLVNSML